MSALDVERLVEAMKALLSTGLKGADEYRLVMMACKGDALSDEEQLQAEEFGAAVKASREALSALSSRPDSIPPQDDVSGRLAEVLELLLDGNYHPVESHCAAKAALAAYVAYRANPSGAHPLRYEALKEGDILREGDEFKSSLDHGWWPIPTESIGLVYTGRKFTEHRRPVCQQQAHELFPPGNTVDAVVAETIRKARAFSANPSGWIPVGERLPEDSGSIVLAWDRIDRRPFILAAWELADQTRFTLWQPMPPPPQDEPSGRIDTAPEEIDAAQRHMREGKV